MKAIYVYNHLKSKGTWVKWNTTCDQFLIGDENTEITGIAVGWMPSFRNLEQTLKELCNLFMRTIRCISEAVINLRYWWAGPFVINLLLDTGKNIPMPRSCMKMMSGSRSENGWNNTELSLCAVTTYGMSFEKLVFTELGQNGSDLPEGPYKR